MRGRRRWRSARRCAGFFPLTVTSRSSRTNFSLTSSFSITMTSFMSRMGSSYQMFFSLRRSPDRERHSSPSLTTRRRGACSSGMRWTSKLTSATFPAFNTCAPFQSGRTQHDPVFKTFVHFCPFSCLFVAFFANKLTKTSEMGGSSRPVP